MAGALYAAWLLAPEGRPPGPLWRATVGALCGSAGCAVVALAVSPGSPAVTLLVLGVHGAPAGLAMGLLMRPGHGRLRKPGKAATSTHAACPRIESRPIEPRSLAPLVRREHVRHVRFFSGY